VALLGLSGAWGAGRFVSQTLLARDAETMMVVLNSMPGLSDAVPVIAKPGTAPHPEPLAQFLAQLGHLPGSLRANLYGADRRLLSSSDPGFARRDLPANPELEEAFDGKAVAESGIAGQDDKEEHAELAPPGTFFVENYLPIWSRSAPKQVIGVAEVYRTPPNLAAAIVEARRLVWLAILVSGIMLYMALIGIVRQAARIMNQQQRELAQTPALAALGAMASAVAHGLRNPLASVRAAAELATLSDPDEGQRLMGEVIADVDRLEDWIRQYLSYAHDAAAEPEPVPLRPVVLRCVWRVDAQCRRHGVTIAVDLPPDLPPCAAHPLLLDQLLASLVANAVEAMPQGGQLTIGARAAGERVSLSIADTGAGMSEAELARAFQPFQSKKRGELGLGLPLAAQITRRLGGGLELRSEPGRGAEALLRLRAAGD
jgi:two-component system sensor histidine kinase HydH